MHSSRKCSNVVCHCSLFIDVLLCTVACLLFLFEVDEQEAGALGTERQQDALQDSGGHSQGQQQRPQVV